MAKLPITIPEVADLAGYTSRLYEGKSALIDYDEGAEYSYIELETRARRVAGFLSDLGIGRGDRVAYVLSNRIECFDLFNAALKVGAVLVPISWRLSPPDVARILWETRPKLLFYEKPFSDLVNGAMSSYRGKLEKVSLEGEGPLGEYSWSDVLASKTLPRLERINLEDAMMILYTGGTTGFPKPALIPIRQIVFNIFSEILTWRLHHRYKTVLMLPLFHTGGWNLLTLPLLAVGGSVYITRRFVPSKVLEILETEEGPFVLFGVPTMYYMIAREKEFRDAKLGSVEWMLSGGSFIDRALMEQYWDKGVKMAQGYGSTEAGPNNLTMPVQEMSIEEIRRKWKSVGRPFAFNQVWVVDDDGNTVAGPGSLGELVICGPLIFSGYLDRDEETRKILRNGCIYTGDIAYIDEEGFYYIVDRKKDVIKSGGEQIYPREIEELAIMHPKVDDAAVIGVPDPVWGEAVKIVIKPKPETRVTKEEILQFLRTMLPSYKVPKYFAIVDTIPRGPTGKLLRSALREQYGLPRDDI